MDKKNDLCGRKRLESFFHLPISIDNSCSCSCGDGTGAQPTADWQEEQVCHDDQQRGHADNKLHQQVVCLAEVSLDDAQCGGDGGSCHHGEQRHRQDGSRHVFRNIVLFHNILEL